MSDRSRRRGPSVPFLCALATLSWPGGAVAQISVEFSPSSVNLALGESALVEVTVTGVPAQGLAAFQLDLDFDPLAIDVLNPNEAFRGTVLPFIPLGNDPDCTLVRATPTCQDPIWFLTSTGRVALGIDTIDNVNGHVQVAYGTSGPEAPPLGDGTIALIEIFAEYNGTAAVTLADVILADGQQPPVPFVVSPGSLTVVSGTGIANQPPLLSAIGDRSLFEGQSLNVPLSSSDPDGNGLTLSATGLPPFCNLEDSGDGTGSLECFPAVGDAGAYPVVVRVTDDGAPNLDDAEPITITVDVTNCNDGDGDGYGLPGDVSCPEGALEDCDDADPAIHPAAVEICRSGIDENCNGVHGASEPGCLSPTCAIITLGAPGTDPLLTMGDPAACPSPGVLPRSADLVWGDLGSVRVEGVEIRLGDVLQLACAGTSDTVQFDNLAPAAGQVDFYLARESGEIDYGTGGGLPRLPDSGDCP